ncbi:MAG TPA: hypothetical protein VGA49_00220, partial [Patescibacteria group bacterium]
MFYADILKIFILTTVSFMAAIAWTPLLTHFLYKYRLGKRIRSSDQAPVMSDLHQHKSGTPVMGGLLIWVTTLVLALVFFYLSVIFPETFFSRLNFLTRSQTLLPLGALVASALVGLVDDYLNIKKVGPNGGGLSILHRLTVYTLVAAVGA